MFIFNDAFYRRVSALATRMLLRQICTRMYIFAETSLYFMCFFGFAYKSTAKKYLAKIDILVKYFL